MMRRLAHDLPEAERRRWRIVRLDTHQEVPGLILSADADTGAATLKVEVGVDIAEDGTRSAKYETQSLSFGPGGFAIVGR